MDDSSREKGLNLEVYTKRLADFLNMTVDDVKREILPPETREWQYMREAGIEWRGDEWYFKTTEEIDEFAKRIKDRMAKE